MDWDYGIYLPVTVWEDNGPPHAMAKAYFDLVEGSIAERSASLLVPHALQLRLGAGAARIVSLKFVSSSGFTTGAALGAVVASGSLQSVMSGFATGATLGAVVGQLLGMNEAAAPFRKAGVWWLRYRVRDGVGRAVVVAVQSPDTI